MFLPKNTFKTIVEFSPLVSIDLVIQNPKNQFLVGLRKNSPAQNFWFVPGGRIQKNERLAAAFKRLTQQELGVELCIEQAEPLGAFDHLYKDSIFGDSVSTHYVAIAYKIPVTHLPSLPDHQHSDYQWLNAADILSRGDVHDNTKAYFKNA